jgi:hypothetical protein
MKYLHILILICLSATGFCQLKVPELSPAGRVIQSVGFTNFEVYYERPAARGRTAEYIFGTLVPMGKVWRTGAGNCTTISFDTDVQIGSKTVSAGKYALFTIPNVDKWTIILNRDTLAYGAYRYDVNKDVVRVDAKPIRSDRFYESLTIDIDVIPNNARMYISWMNTQVAFDIKTGLDEQITAYINKHVITGQSANADDYEAAVNYYLWHNGDRTQMMKFIDKGISLRNDRIWYYWKVDELMRLKKYNEATKAAEAGIATIQKSDESPERKKELIADFEVKLKDIKALR